MSFVDQVNEIQNQLTSVLSYSVISENATATSSINEASESMSVISSALNDSMSVFFNRLDIPHGEMVHWNVGKSYSSFIGGNYKKVRDCVLEHCDGYTNRNKATEKILEKIETFKTRMSYHQSQYNTFVPPPLPTPSISDGESSSSEPTKTKNEYYWELSSISSDFSSGISAISSEKSTLLDQLDEVYNIITSWISDGEDVMRRYSRATSLLAQKDDTVGDQDLLVFFFNNSGAIGTYSDELKEAYQIVEYVIVNNAALNTTQINEKIKERVFDVTNISSKSRSHLTSLTTLYNKLHY